MKNQEIVRKGGRWVRVGILTLTMAGPVVNAFLQRLRSQAARTSSRQESVGERLDEIGGTVRRQAAEQAKQLQFQARQLQMQARELRDALREETRQRRRVRRLTKQLREMTGEWREELAKRSEYLTEQGGRLSQELRERGEKLTQELSERGGKLTHDLTERGGRVAQDLAEQSGKLTHGLVERGGEFFQSQRKRNSTFWTLFGFTVGLVTAGVITYIMVRRRVIQQEIEADQRIELPTREEQEGTQKGSPVGEILYFDVDGSGVATLQIVDVAEQPADVAFVGIASTKRYYPVEAVLDTAGDAKELVYFISEDEAKAQGFSREG